MIESTEPRRGRTAPLDEAQADRLFRQGVSLFNGVRYWHAHEAWETLWRAATDDERDFYQGLIQLAAGLLHLERRNLRGARNKLAEGIERLRPYRPTHHDIAVSDRQHHPHEAPRRADCSSGGSRRLSGSSGSGVHGRL